MGGDPQRQRRCGEGSSGSRSDGGFQRLGQAEQPDACDPRRPSRYRATPDFPRRGGQFRNSRRRDTRFCAPQFGAGIRAWHRDCSRWTPGSRFAVSDSRRDDAVALCCPRRPHRVGASAGSERRGLEDDRSERHHATSDGDHEQSGRDRAFPDRARRARSTSSIGTAAAHCGRRSKSEIWTSTMRRS